MIRVVMVKMFVSASSFPARIPQDSIPFRVFDEA